MKEIVLALGGGGAKGSAHMGVLRVLEREGFKIRAVSGTSAGAICASLYAFGYSPDEIQRRMWMANQASMFAREPTDGPSWTGVVASTACSKTPWVTVVLKICDCPAQ